MNNYGSSNFKRDSSGYNTSYPGFGMGGNSSGGGGGYGGDGASNTLLQEQKKINDELRDEMRQMQMQIRMMTTNMMNLNQGGGSSGSGMGLGMGSGTGMGNNMMQGGGGGSGVNVWNHQDGGYPSTFSSNTGYPNMGQGYRDESGGGKMGGYSAMVPSRNVPYNHRVPKQPGDWDCPQCGNMNFSRRTTCNGNGGNCGVPKKPEYVRQGVKDEKRDWTCIKCNNLNYSYRIACNKCGIDKSVGAEAGGGASKITKKDGDWFCPKCNNMNFSYRNKCNKCKFDKKDLDEQGPSHSSGGSMGGAGPSNSMMDGMGGNNMNNIAAMMNMAMQSMGVNSGMLGMGNMGGGPMGGPPMANSSMGGMMGGGGGGPKMALRRHKGPEPKEGDWECPRCYNLNFSSRLACNGNKDGEFCDLQKPELQKYKVKAWKDASYIKDSDWDCWICSNVNFANRESCNKCKTDKAEAQKDSLRKKRSS